MATVSQRPGGQEAQVNGAQGRATPSELAGAQPPATTLDWGNSAPLALFAFAVTTFMLSMVNADAIAKGVEPAVFGVALMFGGLTQLIAGIIQLRVGNTFAGVLFSGFGAFWLSLFANVQWFLKDVPPAHAGAGIGPVPVCLRDLRRAHVGRVAAHERRRRLGAGDSCVRVLLPRSRELWGSHDVDPLGRLYRARGCRVRLLSSSRGALRVLIRSGCAPCLASRPALNPLPIAAKDVRQCRTPSRTYMEPR